MVKIDSRIIRLLGIFLIIIGLLLFGLAITGKTIVGSYTVSDYCEKDSDCLGGKICCNVYEGGQGTCYTPNQCNDLIEGIKGISLENPYRSNKQAYIFSGIALTLIGILLIIKSYGLDKKNIKKSTTNKKSKIKNKK